LSNSLKDFEVLMAFRGRRPTLSVVKNAMGNPGHRRANENEPEPAGDGVRPKFVKGRAKKLWDQYAPDLIANRILTSWDAHSFGRLCCEWADYEANPTAFNSARKSEMRKHESQFGLGDPAGRTRLSNGKKDSTRLKNKFYA
jgi:phage terminase small subunit